MPGGDCCGGAGFGHAYLTTIDLERNVQRIVFSRNTQALNIPEGLEVPWGDTLCKQALDEGRPYVDDVAGCWGDSDAARVLGITTYLSEPVHVAAGELYGTLCAASGARIQVTDDTRRLRQLFSQLIARQLERDRLLAQLKDENLEYSRHALSDPLTGIPNRRSLMKELARALANAGTRGHGGSYGMCRSGRIQGDQRPAWPRCRRPFSDCDCQGAGGRHARWRFCCALWR